MTLRSIDVFSGGGGLTVGMKRAGFEVVAAVEIESNAYSTYRVNHPEVHTLKQDLTTVSGSDLKDLVGAEQIDLLAGCPPCQGFTSLTSKYKRQDTRNILVLEMARLAEEILPRAIMMENVPGLIGKGKGLYGQLREQLQSFGYVCTEGILQVADFGVPQQRRRFVLLAGLGFKIDLPQPTHSRTGQNGLPTWRTVRDAIGHMKEPMKLVEAKKQGGVERSDWHVVRNISPQNAKRIASVEAGQDWTSIPEELRPQCHQGEYRGFSNVYGRMEWDRPSPAITSGCTTFSMGRFGHPEEDRTISVREAALLQTFPRDYRFDTPYMEYVCNIIGNALPCDFAEAVSRQCHAELASSN